MVLLVKQLPLCLLKLQFGKHAVISELSKLGKLVGE
jgi:hypothetical protein